MREQGFDDVLFKPFRPEVVDDFLLRYFDNQDFLQVEDNVLKVAPFSGKADKVDRFYGRLHGVFAEALEKVAAACYDDVVLDMGTPPLEGDKLPKLVIAVQEKSKEFGMSLLLVGPAEVRKILGGYEETKDVRFYGSVQEAHSAAGSA
jgi:DNA-binding response OmpR family regulator